MNQKSIGAVLGVVVVILIGTTVYFATINNASQPVSSDPKVTQQPTSAHATQPTQPDVNNQSPAVDYATKTPEQIIQGLLTPEEKAANPKITIVKAADSHMRAELFFNPGGYYFLVAKVSGEWKKVLSGNGIPRCKDVAQYNFPKDMIDTCENGN